MSFNPKLFDCAQYAIGHTKLAFVPSGGAAPQDPAAMGAPPPGAPSMDPAAAGAAPPAGAPPMDPAATAGAPPAPPTDPNAVQPGAGAPAPAPAPPSGGMDPEMIRSIIREEMAANGGGQQKPKGPKVTPEQMYQENVRTRKMLTHMFGLMGWGLPPDILNDDIPQDGGGGGGGGSSGGSKPSSGSSGQSKSAIAPIKPLVGAFPMSKAASSSEVVDSADALLRLLHGG